MKNNRKWKTRAFGKDIYWLGADKDGINYFLEKASWDCDWYWGFGYIKSYTNNKQPGRSRDITTHRHFDDLFLKGNGFEKFKILFVISPLSDAEIWKLLELMKSFYIAKNYGEMIYRGGANFTKNPAMDVIKNEQEYNRINKIIIPEICKNVYKLLGGEEEC